MATTRDPDPIALLAELIERDRQAVLAYDEAIGRLEDPTASTRLRELRAEHERHVRELSECVVELGGAPPRPAPDGPCAARLGDATSTRAILRAMHACEESTREAYRQALRSGAAASPRVREILERCLEDERRHGSWLATQVL